jgi:hypothetical protein
MRTRSERRHHRERMINRVKNFKWIQPKYYHGPEEQRQKYIRELADTRHPCSCDMCCNPRHNGWARDERLTMQERRHIYDDKEYLE